MGLRQTLAVQTAMISLGADMPDIKEVGGDGVESSGFRIDLRLQSGRRREEERKIPKGFSAIVGRVNGLG
jgi:hypothetical protein